MANKDKAGLNTAIAALTDGGSNTAALVRSILVDIIDSSRNKTDEPVVDGADGAKGDKGDTGDTGAQGVDGLNAYDIAVADGFVGNEAAWLASLVGADGADGANGQDGAQGIQGIQGLQGVAGQNGQDGADGSNGLDGADGDSAYQVWLDLGNSGTEQDFIDDITGADGAQGIQGIQGIQGNAGADGSDGLNGVDGDDGLSTVVPVMLNCLARAASTISANQSHDGTHKVAYNGTPAVGSLPSWLTISGDGFTMTITEDGIYELDHNTFIAATAGARSSVSARFAVGGVVEGARSATGYIRLANSHAESSTHIAGHLVERDGSNIAITVPLGNESAVAATNASMGAGESTLTIKKLT